ncbi:MAG: hypothetical protein ABJH05_11190 [Fulvivirga sp.]
MNSFSLLVILICGFMHSNSPTPVNLDIKQCDLKVEALIDESELTLKVSNDAVEPVRYFLADETSKLISEDKNTKNLKRGTYTYYVIDKKGCSNKGEIEIK